MKSIITLLFLAFTTIGSAQNTTRFSQFNMVKGLLNPGAVGTEAKFSAELIHRNQWTGVAGAPLTTGFVAGAEIIPSMAVGLTAIYDQVGIAKTTNISAAYAYRAILNEEQYFSFGISAGVQNINADYTQVKLTEMNDEAFIRGYNKWKFNAGAGVYYNGPKMYAGLSVPELVQNTSSVADQGFTPTRWHYYLSSGFYLGKESSIYSLNPCVQIKLTPNAPIQGDLLLRNVFRGVFAFTLGYRSENSLIAGMDFMISNTARIGYSFNYNLGPYNAVNGQSHEVYLGFGLPYYYQGNKFQQRKYLNKKGLHTRDYRKATKRVSRSR